MKNLTLFFYSLFSVLLLFSCEKQNVFPLQPCEPSLPLAAVSDTCFSAPTSFGFGPYSGLPKSVLSFAVNPNEGSELALISYYTPPEIDQPEGNITIWTSDICTVVQNKIWSSRQLLYRELDWSASGWIMHYNQDLESWVRSQPETGESVILMNEYAAENRWLTDSTFISTFKPTPTAKRQTHIKNWQGHSIDTLPVLRTGMAALNNRVVGHSNSFDTLFLYDAEQREITELAVFSPEEAFHHISWANDDYLWLARKDGIYRFNITTRDISLLKDTSCDNYFYHMVIPNPDNSDQLYVNRIDYRYRSDGSIRYSQTINLLSVETLEEKEIQFFE